jgi:hypothetical protein
MSVYPGKLSEEKVGRIEKDCSGAGIELVKRDGRQFRYLVYDTQCSDRKKVYEHCDVACTALVVRDSVLFPCSQVPTFERLFGDSCAGAGVALNNTNKDELTAFLKKQTEAPAACGRCAFGAMVLFPWEEVDEKVWMEQAWTVRSTP